MKFYGTTTLNGVTYTWPGADGGAGEVLSTNGGGTLSWAAGAADGDWSIDVPNSYVYNTTDRIGIGTASPATYLEIDFSDATTTYVGSSAQYGLIIANTDATANNWAQIAFSAQAGAQPAAWIGTHFTDHANLYGDLVFGTRGAGGVGQHMTIDQDGKVGIGTTSPDGPLHIYVADATVTAATAADDLIIENATGGASSVGMTIVGSTNDNCNIYMGDSGSNYRGAIVYSNSADALSLVSAAATGLTLDSNSNVGIGTATPGWRLEVNGNGVVVGVKADATHYTYLYPGTTGGNTPAIGYYSVLRFYDDDGTSETMRIDTAGNVGIGDTTPTYKLDVNGTLRATGNATFDSQVGIGAGPSSALTITGANSDIYLINTSTGSSGIAWYDSPSTLDAWLTVTESSGVMQMGTIQAADVEFYVSNTKRMWLEGSNNGIYFVGPPVPETDGGVNLGDTSIRWATTWTDNITTSGHVGIGTGFDGTWALKVEDADRWAASFSTTSSGAAGPTVALYLNSSSPADGDHCGYLTWYGNNSTPTSISYGYMFVNTGDVTAGTEDANWYIYLYSGGSLNLASYITGPGQVNGDLAYNEFDEWDDRDQLELAVKDPARVDLRIQDALFTWHPDHIGHDGKMRPMLNYSVAFNFLAGGVYQNRDHIVEVERRMDGLWEEAHQARQWQEDYGVKVIDIADRLETQEQKVERLQKENAESSEREAELTKRVAELERLAA